MKLLLFNFLGPEMLIIFLAFGLFIPYILYIRTLQKTLEEISMENRLMTPRNVWLLLIPLFGNFYLIYVVSQLGQSLAQEFKARGISTSEEKPGFIVGIAMSVSLIISSFIKILGLVGLVCWIIHWVKISQYKNTLIKNPADDIIEHLI